MYVHGQVVVGNPPTHMMEDAAMATPFGIVMAGKDSVQQPPSLTQYEVKLAFGMGEWTAQVRTAREAVLLSLPTPVRMAVFLEIWHSDWSMWICVQVAKLLHDLDMA